MSLPCPVPSCTRVMPGHHTVCRACSAGLLRALADVPSLDIHLDLALTRQARLGTPGGGRGGETALPWDQRARDARDVLRSALVGWVRALQADADEERSGPVCRACEHPSCAWIDATHAPADTLPALARWLTRHRRALLAHPAVEEAVDEIRAAIANARRAIDRPADRIYAGPCAECGTDMYARPGAATVVCPVCVDEHGHRLRYLVSQLRDWMLAGVEDLLLPAPDVARALTSLVRPIAPALLYTWVARRRLAPRTTDGRGRALFRVGDVLELMQPSTPAACRDDQRGDML